MNQTAIAASQSEKYTIVTNNWLCDLWWQRESGIRFDNKLRFSGGEDTKFFKEAKQSNCRTEWCDHAVVKETQSLDRLSLRYQYRRAAAQALNHFRMKHGKVTVKNFLAAVLAATIKFILGVFLFLVPVLGIASLVVSVRSLGWSYGRIRAIFGGTAEFYKPKN